MMIEAIREKGKFMFYLASIARERKNRSFWEVKFLNPAVTHAYEKQMSAMHI